MFVISGEQRWDNAGAGNNTHLKTATTGVFPSLVLFILFLKRREEKQGEAKGSKVKQMGANGRKRMKREEQGSRGKQKESNRSKGNKKGEKGRDGKGNAI